MVSFGMKTRGLILYLLIMSVVLLPSCVKDNETSEASQPDQGGNSTAFVLEGEIDSVVIRNVSFTMIKVEGGTFTMGAHEDDDEAFENERPEHGVILSDYYIGETEVTQKLWEAVVGFNPSQNSVAEDHPVDNISWRDCEFFIEKLNQLTGMHFRLPTEAEWEFAARGGIKCNNYRYSGSDTIDLVGWYSVNALNNTHPVKTKRPNELGIYDMTGNVWEWCNDWYGLYTNQFQTNPQGASTGIGRVYRGGCCGFNSVCGRVSFRDYFAPNYHNDFLGLRLVHDVVE